MSENMFEQALDKGATAAMAYKNPWAAFNEAFEAIRKRTDGKVTCAWGPGNMWVDLNGPGGRLIMLDVLRPMCGGGWSVSLHHPEHRDRHGTSSVPAEGVAARLAYLMSTPEFTHDLEKVWGILGTGEL